MFLSDAYALQEPVRAQSGTPELGVVEDALDRLQAEGGYTVIRTEYGEGEKWEKRYMIGLARVALAGHEIIRLNGRNAIAMQLAPNGDSGLQVLGVHLSDETENDRVAQVTTAKEYLKDAPYSAIIGDCNGLHGEDGRSRTLAHPLAGAAAKRFPGERIRYIGERVHQMAWGSAFRILELGGFRDSDQMHRPTFPSRFPVLHLDRCFVSDEAVAHDFTVAPHHSGSDHRSIDVVIET